MKNYSVLKHSLRTGSLSILECFNTHIPKSVLGIHSVMAASRSPKPSVQVRVLVGTPIMGCWYRWEHSSFASFNPRFDPGTVHQIKFDTKVCLLYNSMSRAGRTVMQQIANLQTVYNGHRVRLPGSRPYQSIPQQLSRQSSRLLICWSVVRAHVGEPISRLSTVVVQSPCKRQVISSNPIVGTKLPRWIECFYKIAASNLIQHTYIISILLMFNKIKLVAANPLINCRIVRC